MKKKKTRGCNHEIGYRAIGGFPGHEHIHTAGEQYCFNCGKILEEIIQEAYHQGINQGWEDGYEDGKSDGRREIFMPTK